MAILLAVDGHEFWPDDVTLLDHQRIDSTRLLDSGQVTDSYLLALACAHNGQLATFDRHLVSDAVIGGTRALHVIV
jgi:predicted nucleic acid-binding protein